MSTFILFWISTVLAVIVGDYLGQNRHPKSDLKRIAEKIKDHTLNIALPSSDLAVGIIRRPTARQLFKKHENEQTAAQKEAMRDTLDTIPEVRAQRKDL